MNIIRAKWLNGQVVLEEPANWPEGSELVVGQPELTGVAGNGDDQANDAQSIAQWLAWYDSLEPLIFSPQEEADLSAWRTKVKEHTIANMHESAEGVFE